MTDVSLKKFAFCLFLASFAINADGDLPTWRDAIGYYTAGVAMGLLAAMNLAESLTAAGSWKAPSRVGG